MKTSGVESENIKNTHFEHKFGAAENELTVPENRHVKVERGWKLGRRKFALKVIRLFVVDRGRVTSELSNIISMTQRNFFGKLRNLKL